MAQEGGPGYPSTGTAPDFADMLGGLLDQRNLLVVDARGTGRSTPVDCEPLQSLDPVSPKPTFQRAVADCGDATVSGTVRSDGIGLAASARVTLRPDHGRPVEFVIDWATTGRGTRATVRAGRWVLTVPAP